MNGCLEWTFIYLLTRCQVDELTWQKSFVVLYISSHNGHFRSSAWSFLQKLSFPRAPLLIDFIMSQEYSVRFGSLNIWIIFKGWWILYIDSVVSGLPTLIEMESVRPEFAAYLPVPVPDRFGDRSIVVAAWFRCRYWTFID